MAYVTYCVVGFPRARSVAHAYAPRCSQTYASMPKVFPRYASTCVSRYGVRTKAVFAFVRTWISLSRGNKPVMPITHYDQLNGGCEQNPAAREPRKNMTYRLVETQHVFRHAAPHRSAPRHATPQLQHARQQGPPTRV